MRILKERFQGLLLVRGILQRLSPSTSLPHDCHATHAPQSRAGQPPTHWRKARVGACTLQPVCCTWDCAVAAVWPTALRLLAVDEGAPVSTILEFFFFGDERSGLMNLGPVTTSSSPTSHLPSLPSTFSCRLSRVLRHTSPSSATPVLPSKPSSRFRRFSKTTWPDHAEASDHLSS